MRALTGAFDRAIQTMIANANAAGWSTDEALGAIDGVVAQLKMQNAVDPDPADDPEVDEDVDQAIAVQADDPSQAELVTQSEAEDESRVQDDDEYLFGPVDDIPSQVEQDAPRRAAGQ
ncbi:hypothetical protein [Rhizobium sp. TRM95796]|uniref:hypothetical protein n=1 Tax=Rhizobium sp. TRM95796 TaxID=2979862 RepID=UPI0021E9859F|nr:hypothetical protein [Rhizobium sp. TRM95796]MCV3766748.1 hypothetical protein [Rhizobium sp. TRM95796]